MGFKRTDSCLKKTPDNEPIFVLRAQDESSPKVILHWMAKNFETLSIDKLREALETAIAMKAWPKRKTAD